MDYQRNTSKIKRLNKNRPEEVSSKRPPRKHFSNKLHERIDPRFDSAFGDFNDTAFKNSYAFVNEIKEREKVQLMRQLKQEKNPEEVKKLKFLLSRISNQEREKKKQDIKQKRLNDEKQKFAEAVFAGQTPSYPNKKEKLAEEVIESYENLNSSGKLDKYLKKKLKKQSKPEQF